MITKCFDLSCIGTFAFIPHSIPVGVSACSNYSSRVVEWGLVFAVVLQTLPLFA